MTEGLTVKQVLVILAERGVQISEAALRGHVARGTVQCVRVSNHVLIVDDLSTWSPGRPGWKKGKGRKKELKNVRYMV